MLKSQARKLIKKILKKHNIEMEVTFEETIPEFGDLSTAMCFGLASSLKKSPKAIAEEFVKEAENEIPDYYLIKEIKAVNGYINFYLNYEKFAKLLLKQIKKLGKKYGSGGKKKEKIILEHTSANPDGPLHIGHARNAIIGDTLAKIMRFAGYKVETQFYVNDMGKQLAVVVWGLKKLNLDKTKKKDEGIGEVYIEANKMLEKKGHEEEISQLLKSYENGDANTVREFKNAASYCIEGINQTLERISIEHDKFVWESDFVRSGEVKKVVKQLKKTKHAKQNEVFYLDLKDFGIEKELILTRKDGTYLYTTRDIAYHIWKSKKGTVINVWGADHKLVAKQLAAVLKILKHNEPEFIIYEFISLPEGSMSTRRGIFISLDWLIEESIKRAYAEVNKRRADLSEEFKKKIAESVGIAAVRYNIVKVSPEKAIIFKWEEALDFDRQGAPFIQYAYARACRILEKEAPKENFEVPQLSEHEKNLLKIISKFPDIVEEAAEFRKASLIANYAFELADAFHRFYMFEPVLKSKEKDFRLNLVLGAKITLENTLKIIGIEPLEAM